MKIIITILVLGGLGYFVFFHGNTSETDVPIEDEQATGALVDTYNKYQGAVNDARSVVADLEERNKISNQ